MRFDTKQGSTRPKGAANQIITPVERTQDDGTLLWEWPGYSVVNIPLAENKVMRGLVGDVNRARSGDLLPCCGLYMDSTSYNNQVKNPNQIVAGIVGTDAYLFGSESHPLYIDMNPAIASAQGKPSNYWIGAFANEATAGSSDEYNSQFVILSLLEYRKLKKVYQDLGYFDPVFVGDEAPSYVVCLEIMSVPAVTDSYGRTRLSQTVSTQATDGKFPVLVSYQEHANHRKYLRWGYSKKKDAPSTRLEGYGTHWMSSAVQYKDTDGNTSVEGDKMRQEWEKEKTEEREANEEACNAEAVDPVVSSRRKRNPPPDQTGKKHKKVKPLNKKLKSRPMEG
jgi:hypothetical protein